MDLRLAVQNFVERALGVHAFLGRFAGVMPLANSPQVLQRMVIARNHVVALGCAVIAPRAVLFQDFATSLAPFKYGRAEGGPVGGQP